MNVSCTLMISKAQVLSENMKQNYNKSSSKSKKKTKMKQQKTTKQNKQKQKQNKQTSIISKRMKSTGYYWGCQIFLYVLKMD